MGRSIGNVFAFANTIFCYFVDFVSICAKVAKKISNRGRRMSFFAQPGRRNGIFSHIAKRASFTLTR
ncbi:uncharacterized protein EpC_22210 [Erwinia pyrifoliae Ep1/96]|nr:uncharacterized protein EpC_22210 [Erwinia pyrifoliae Ep1/96]